MKLSSTLGTAIFVFTLPAYTQPLPADQARLETCIANIEKVSAEAGEPAEDPKAVCMCLGGKIMQNPDLQSEIAEAGGLPSLDQSSEAMKAVVAECKDAKSKD